MLLLFIYFVHSSLCFLIMASRPNTSWKIDGETMETVTYFILGGSKITADGDCSHEIKWCFLLGRKSMTNLDSILKSRHVTLAANVPSVTAMFFPVVMYGCESWTINKAECQRIDAFELWYWRRFLRESWGPKKWCSWTVMLEKILESLGLQGDPKYQS